MAVEYRKFITRAQLKHEPLALFVFGDNMEGFGSGGQAREMRGEFNAVGIPTKWAPNMSPAAFFADADFDEVRPSIDAAFERLERHIAKGGHVIWPEDGIGSGLADLPRRSPKIWHYIETRRMGLETRQ